jgi:Flp pilus assembly protein TadG
MRRADTFEQYFHRRRPRRASERGAALVETALCALFLLLIMAGVLEYGQLFGGTIDVASATRSAAFVGAATTDEVVTDAKILASIQQAPGANRDNIQRVVIYRADATGQPPPACLTSYPAPAGSACNVYLSSDLTKTDSQLASLQRWPPASRAPGTDNLGVYVAVQRQRLFSMVASPEKFGDKYVVRIEPKTTTSPGETGVNVGGWTTGTSNSPGWKWCGDDGGQWYSFGGTCEDGSSGSGPGIPGSGGTPGGPVV